MANEMTICKQCVHYLVCMHYSPERKECTQFKDSTNFVEVVRCKDCKRYCKSAIGSDDCLLLCVDVKPDDYCSHGERREGE